MDTEPVEDTRTYVLVHGAWHGGWCWSRVVPLLSAAGHRVVTPTLTGQGDRVHLLDASINLTTHVTDVVNTIELEDLNDVILVGHSYAGLVITGVAELVSQRIKRLVYLDALVPGHGQCGFDLNSPEFKESWEKQASDIGEGFKILPKTETFGVTDPNDLEWMRSRLSPFPIGAMGEVVYAPTAAKSIPSSFIMCTEFGFQDTAERCKKMGWPVMNIDCGHDAMIVKPKELADLLLSRNCC